MWNRGHLGQVRALATLTHRRHGSRRVTSGSGRNLEGLGTAATGISNRMLPSRIFTSREIQWVTADNDAIAESILVTKVCMLVHVINVL